MVTQVRSKRRCYFFFHFVSIASFGSVVGLSLPAWAATYYVSPDGSDSAAGTMDAPFATFARGQQAAAAGDTVYFRKGTYLYRNSTNADAISVTKSGSSGKRINYWAYQNEVPVFDFSGMTKADRITGLRVTASWVHIKGLEVKLVPQNVTDQNESWGVYNLGDNNIYEMLNLHHNMGPGFFLGGGANNLILNCDSHHNYDPKSKAGMGENADGFGCHPKQGDTGNIYRGIRAWWNTDDGFDCISAQEACQVEGSWAWLNGYLPDQMVEPMRKPTTPPGNGNGFKLGGFGLDGSGSPANPPRHTIKYSVAFLNVYAGFFANYHTGSNSYYDNTGFGNGADFDMMGLNNKNTSLLRNNLAYGPNKTRNMTGTDSQSNSWDLPVQISEADFQSISTMGMDGPRQADGSLPIVPFMRLVAGSDLIDKGVVVNNVTGPFGGTAPDLGAYESGVTAAGGGAGAGGAGGSKVSDGGAGAGGGSGGTSGAGGATGSGGASNTGGAGGGGGSTGAGGGAAGSGGATGGDTTGGAGSGGTTGGGSVTSGGAGTAAGSGGTGGSATNGGASGTGGAAGSASGAAGTSPSAPASDSGCGCRVGTTSSSSTPLLVVSAALVGLAELRRRRRSSGVQRS